jgi:hypothetical protein
MACSFIHRFSHECHKYGISLFSGLSGSHQRKKNRSIRAVEGYVSVLASPS